MEGSTPLKSPPIHKWGMATPCFGIALPGPPDQSLGVTTVTGSILEMHILDSPHLKSNMGRAAQYRNPSCGARGRNWMLHVHTVARKILRKHTFNLQAASSIQGRIKLTCSHFCLFCPFLQSLMGFQLSRKAQIWRCSPTLM